MKSKCTFLHLAWAAHIVEGRVGPVERSILLGTLPCNTIGLYCSNSPHPGFSMLWCTSDDSMTHEWFCFDFIILVNPFRSDGSGREPDEHIRRMSLTGHQQMNYIYE